MPQGTQWKSAVWRNARWTVAAIHERPWAAACAVQISVGLARSQRQRQSAPPSSSISSSTSKSSSSALQNQAPSNRSELALPAQGAQPLERRSEHLGRRRRRAGGAGRGRPRPQLRALGDRRSLPVVVHLLLVLRGSVGVGAAPAGHSGALIAPWLAYTARWCSWQGRGAPRRPPGASRGTRALCGNQSALHKTQQSARSSIRLARLPSGLPALVLAMPLCRPSATPRPAAGELVQALSQIWTSIAHHQVHPIAQLPSSTQFCWPTSAWRHALHCLHPTGRGASHPRGHASNAPQSTLPPACRLKCRLQFLSAHAQGQAVNTCGVYEQLKRWQMEGCRLTLRGELKVQPSHKVAGEVKIAQQRWHRCLVI